MRFSEVLEIKNGKNQRQVENPNGKYPIYGSGGVMGHADDYLCEAETVVIGRKGSINNPIFVEEPFWNVDTAFGLVANKDLLLPKYLYYFCINFNFEALNTTVTIPSLTKANLLQIEINIPSIAEQSDVVSKLDKIGNLIELRKQQLEELDQLVKSRFIELFGDPETNPRKWPISKLSEFCDLQNGYAFRSEDYLDNSTVLNCRMSNIRPDGGFDAEYHPKYLPETFWEKYKEYRLIDGDVIIAMTDMASDPKILGVPTIVRTNGYKFLLNQRVGKLSFYDNSQINNVYLMFVLSQKNIRQQLVKSAGGSTQINVGKPAILGVEFFVPPIELQNQFSTFVEQVDKSKYYNDNYLQSLDKYYFTRGERVWKNIYHTL